MPRKRGRKKVPQNQFPTTMEDFKAEEKQQQEEVAEAKNWLSNLGVKDVINSSLFEETTLNNLNSDFKAEAPFPHLQQQGFLEEVFAKQLAEELKGLDYALRKNDLYEFAQSKDLNDCKLPLITKFREVLYSAEFRQSLGAITGMELKSEVDMFAAVYERGHHLLPHDDQLNTRAVAFIMYFVPPAPEEEGAQPNTEKKTKKKKNKKQKVPPGPWMPEDGGALELLEVDSNGQAGATVKSLLPSWNSFVCFEVSNHSFHQVAEVTSDKLRLSIGGWFHAVAPTPLPPYLTPLPTEVALSPTDSKISGTPLLDEWIQREYRKPRTLKAIQKQFENDSSIELHHFLKKDKYQTLVRSLQAVEFGTQGPRNRCHYGLLDTDAKLPENSDPALLAAHAFCASHRNFLLSEEFAGFLTQLTGVTPLRGSCEVRRFGAGDYTLCHDLHQEWNNAGLDLTFCCLPPAAAKGFTTTHGGTVHYIIKGEEEELLSVYPRVNCLSLVFRASPGALSFVKYVNQQAPCPRFDFNVVYRVPEDSDDEDMQ